MLSYLKSAYESSYKQKSIPSLDGIRAVSILLVILGHSSFIYDKAIPQFASYFSIMQGLGVTTFFCLSGFLINLLLLKERQINNRIDFKMFYIKRLFRIFPPFYLYVLFITIYSTYLLNSPTTIEIVSALTFTWNYVYSTVFWLFGHSWSLSVEEQFYLTWPFLLGLLQLKRSRNIAGILIIASPVIRVACYYLFPDWRGRISIMLHTRMDSLMLGCLLAYFYHEGKGPVFYDVIKRYKLHFLSFVQLLIVSPMLRFLFQGKYALAFGYSLEGVSVIVLITTYIFMKKEDLIFKLLNSRVFRQIGVLSYGLYLWQQFFLFHEIHFKYPLLRFLFLYLCTLLIYLFFEYPIALLSKKIQAKIKV